MKTPIIIATMAAFIFLGCTSSRKANKETTNKNQNSDSLGILDNDSIVNKYWKLITLEGQKVTMAKNKEREIYFVLKPDEKRITGFSGCNTFGGTFTLEAGWRIRFLQMASTMKACPDVDVNEREFLKVFEMADNYTLHNDTLSLNVGRRAPLAVFSAVEFE
ncbi:MAG: META domain-containing protein [Ginsengibacter sp.]